MDKSGLSDPYVKVFLQPRHKLVSGKFVPACIIIMAGFILVSFNFGSTIKY